MARSNQNPKQGKRTVEMTSAPEHSRPASGRSIRLKLALVLATISTLLYINTLKNSFAFDDVNAITENTLVQKGTAAIPEILATPYHSGNFASVNDLYRPLSLVMFAIEYQLLGMQPFYYHLVNILLFAACVVSLFLFLNQLFVNKVTTMFIAALLFALHPIHSEVVANIKSGDELLCFLFAFLSLLLYCTYVRRSGIIYLVAGSILFLLSFLSKESSITFMAVIPLVFFFYLKENRTRSIHITICALVVTCACLFIRFSILNRYHANTFTEVPFVDNALASKSISLASRIATAILILGYYVKLLVIPYPLLCDYSYNTIPFVSFGNLPVLLSLALYLFLMVFGASRLLKNNRDPYAFGVLFFLISISLFTNILFLMDTTMGERLMFFPSVGISLVAALLIEKFGKTAGGHFTLLIRPIALITIIVVAVAFSTITFNRNAEWADNYTLFSTDIKKAPDNCRLNYFLGTELGKKIYVEEKDPAKKNQIIHESITYLSKAAAIAPEFREAHSNLAGAYLNNMQYDSAEVHAKRTVEINPGNVSATNNLAVIYRALKKYPEEIRTYKRLIELQPDYEDAESALGNAYTSNGQLDSGELHELIALKQNPQSVNTIRDLARIYFMKHEYRDAINLCQKVMVLQPALADNYVDAAACYINLSKFDSGIYYLKLGVSASPATGRAYEYLAFSFKSINKLDSAKKYEAFAQRFNPGYKL